MASEVQEFRRLVGGHTESANARVPMILDGGDSARVAAIELHCEPFLGMRFQFDGATWEVTRAKDHVRGWVAKPVPIPWSAS